MLLHVLVVRDGEWLVARCLEHDIAAQAMSFEELRYEFLSTLVGQAMAAKRHGRTLDDLPKSPPEIWEAWQNARTRGNYESAPWAPAGVLPELRADLRFA